MNIIKYKNLSIYFTGFLFAAAFSLQGATVNYVTSFLANDESGSGVFNGDSTFTDFVAAFNIDVNSAPSSVIVNNVTFSRVGTDSNISANHSNNGVTFAMSFKGSDPTGQLASGTTPEYTNLGLNQILTRSMATANVTSPDVNYLEIRITGLEIGQKYYFQTFHHLKSTNLAAREVFIMNDADLTNASDSITAGGDLAATIISTWTADSNTQTFRIANTGTQAGRASFNGALLYTAIPEPTTASLLLGSVVSMICLVGRRLKK